MDPQPAQLNLIKVFALSTFLAIGLVLFISISLIGMAYLIIKKPVATFLDTANLTLPQVRQIAESGWQHNPTLDGSKANILLLGSDVLPNRQGDPGLTDTIILASLDLKTGQVKLLSFPRDMWIESAAAKINTLTYYGEKKDPTQPNKLLVDELTRLTGVPIHHTLTITPTHLAELIDLVGGVEIDVPVSFTDEFFPRTDVDIKTIRDPKKLYETVQFIAGRQVLDGTKALQYMRSRHGNGGQNTDDARSARQQLILTALSQKLLSKTTLTNPELLGKLWQFYDKHFQANLSIEELISLFHYRSNQVSWDGGTREGLQKMVMMEVAHATLPIATRNGRTGKFSEGVLYNPPTVPSKYQGQWVYLVVDEAVFTRTARQLLNYE